MKKILLVFATFLFSQLSTAQYNEVWNFGVQNVGSQLKSSIIDEMGNTIVSARVGIDLHVASFDVANNLNWSKIVQTSQTSTNGEIYLSPNGSFFVRTKQEVMKLDSLGNILWAKELLNPINGLSEACALPNGGFAVMGLISSDYLSTLIVFDRDGNVEWIKKIETFTTASLPRKILITPNGNILTFCAIGGLSGTLFTVWDLNGNVLAEKQFNSNSANYFSSYSPSAKFTENGHLYVTGFIGGQITQSGTRDMVVYHFDKDLNFVNGKRYGYIFNEEGRDIVEDDEGNLIVIGKTKPELVCTGLLKVMKLTPNLDTIYTRHYGDFNQGYVFTAIDRTDSVIYATGYGGFYSHFGSADGYLIKTDNNFNLSCGLFSYPTNVNVVYLTPTSFDFNYPDVDRFFIPYAYETASSISTFMSCSGSGPIPNPSLGISGFNDDDFSIYPNPVTTHLEIAGNTEYDFVKIYSSKGDLVMEQATNSQHTFINCDQLESGMYIVSLIGNRGTVNKKMMKY